MTDRYKSSETEPQDVVNTGKYGSVESALAGDFRIQPIESMKQAWAMLIGFKTTFWLALGAYILIAIVIEMAFAFVLGYSMNSEDYSSMELVGTLISTFVLAPIAGGLYMIAVKYSVGAKIEVGELFNHFDKIIPLFVTTVLMYLLIGLGLILLVIPGIYLLVCFSFSLILVVEKGMSPLDALSTSRKAVHHQWFQMGGLILLSGLIVLLGIFALLVGVVWAIPLVSLALALVYRDVFGVEETTLT